MTVELNGSASRASQPAGMAQARRDRIQPALHAAGAAGRHARLAFLVGGLWLLVAVAVTAAGEGALGICFAALAALWISIALVEHHGTRVQSATQTLPAQIRWQAAPSGG